MSGKVKTKLLMHLQPTQVEDIYPRAVETWCEGVLEGDIDAIPYNEEGIKDEDDVLTATIFYVGHLDEKIALFAGPSSVPTSDDYRYDPDEGWMKFNF